MSMSTASPLRPCICKPNHGKISRCSCQLYFQHIFTSRNAAFVPSILCCYCRGRLRLCRKHEYAARHWMAHSHFLQLVLTLDTFIFFCVSRLPISSNINFCIRQWAPHHQKGQNTLNHTVYHWAPNVWSGSASIVAYSCPLRVTNTPLSVSRATAMVGRQWQQQWRQDHHTSTKY